MVRLPDQCCGASLPQERINSCYHAGHSAPLSGPLLPREVVTQSQDGGPKG